MGSCAVKELEDTQAESDAVHSFLINGGKLVELWNQFDKNSDGFIDCDEFKHLLYVSLKYFVQHRNPHKPPPSQSSMKPDVKKLFHDLLPFLDKDKDKKIGFEEFKRYGAYIQKEFEKVQSELSNQK